ncbi:hypothetical protein BDV06DRAFT_218234 [Aspergillus oleicola]
MHPRSRNDFTIAIFCALVLEADAVEATFDEIFDSPEHLYGKAPGDANAYMNGRIGKHNVVLCYLPGMGKGGAASAASTLKVSYPHIELALVAGICGGAPSTGDRQIYLGDVLISDAVVEYDFGARHPDGFRRKRNARNTLGRPNQEIRCLLNKLSGSRARNNFEGRLSQHLYKLQQSCPNSRHPEAADVLFESSYGHRHRADSTPMPCGCSEASFNKTSCDNAVNESCDELGCAGEQIVRRRNPTHAVGPSIHIGTFACADTVLKSGEDRDEIICKEKAIGFEMEGAGVWSNIPCIIIKGVCDYADSHKSKAWQAYAAATEASAARSLLEDWVSSHQEDPANAARFVVMLPRNSRFVGRGRELQELEDWLSLPDGPRNLAITGLGGVGKTQTALELAYRVREKDPECSIFWVPCTSCEALEESYTVIAESVGINIEPGIIKQQVKDYFTNSQRRWLLIFDNADDIDMWTRDHKISPEMKNILPFNEQGRIIFTTRSRRVAASLATAPKYVTHILEPDIDDGLALLRRSGIGDDMLSDTSTCIALLEQLAFLPLAITQATSFIYENGITLLDYLALLQEKETYVIQLLSEDFEDEGRYADIQNPVAMTWLISFKHIQQLDALAAEYLSTMACLNSQNIPKSLLPQSESKLATVKALGILSAYSFITIQHGGDSICVHRLVYLATRNWLRSQHKFSRFLVSAVERLNIIFPTNEYKNRHLWRSYLPHALRILEEDELKSRRQRGDYMDLSERLGMCLFEDGRDCEAEPLIRGVVEYRNREHGTTSYGTIVSMLKLSWVYCRQGSLQEAENLQLQAMESCKRLSQPSHHLLLSCINTLADTYLYQGRPREAENCMVEAIETGSKTLGAENPAILQTMSNLASTYSWQARYREAVELSERGLPTMKRVFGPAHPDTLTSANLLSRCYRLIGHYNEAVTLAEESLTTSRHSLGSEHPVSLTTAAILAGCYNKHGQHSKAVELLQETIDQATAALGESHSDTVFYKGSLANILLSQERWAEAEELLTTLLETYKQLPGPAHPRMLTMMENLTLAREKLGNPSEAIKLRRACAELGSKHSGAEHPAIASPRESPTFKEEDSSDTEAEEEDRQRRLKRRKVNASSGQGMSLES